MKTRLYILASLLLAAFLGMSAATPTAASILDGVRSRMAATPAVEAIFTINGGSGPVQGSVILSGSKYTMNTPQLAVWYDGKTQWTMLKKSQEVSITEPDAEELMETNPFAILSAHRDFYTARRLSDSNGRYRVELTPRSKSSAVARYIIMVNPSTNWPAALIIEFGDGRSIDVVIDSISGASAKSDATFIYDSSKYPTVEVVDLR